MDGKESARRTHVLQTALTANKVFDDDRATLEEKLFKALDEWFGRHVGLFHPEASSRPDFLEKMCDAIHLCCRDLRD
jgi:hypothetical protein